MLSALTSMTHPQAHPLQPYFAKVTITQPTTLNVNNLVTSTSGNHSLRSLVLPGYTQADDTHPKLGWGHANVGLQHVGRIPNCSEVPDRCFFWHIIGFFLGGGVWAHCT